MPAAAAVPPAPEVAPPSVGGGVSPGDGMGRAWTEVLNRLVRFAPLPSRRAAGRVLLVALLVAAICWYFGADVWHSILIGTALTLALVIFDGLEGLDLVNTEWRGGVPINQEGARRDIDDLSLSLRGRYGRVNDLGVSRVRRIARQRLALHHLDLSDPADHSRIEQLIGAGTCAILVGADRRRPSLGSLLDCLDVLDALDPRRPSAPRPRPRRKTPIFGAQPREESP
jgi:hypothetical protein